MTQKGPRAYIIYSAGQAVEIHDMAKTAKERVRELRKHTDAVYVRFSSRVHAEERAAWHNFEYWQRQEQWRAEAETRRATNYARAVAVPARQLALHLPVHDYSSTMERIFSRSHRR